MDSILKERLSVIDRLIRKIKEEKEVRVTDILKEEIDRLKRLNTEYEEVLSKKKVKSKEEVKGNKVKYTLSDGSVYVIHKQKKYKYLYDINTSIITYEFENGQIERTFPFGIKEIRMPDGKIVIKSSDKEYDIL
ncbi:hypothetical protein NEPAR06_2189 [Nematocida parisii]|uniref:Uncharacterized protein n=1 Tax=Nematocida parisii (strain ERTm3) TaxID=935791 RepID=I3EFY3_NEMP3|nr:uncharacterized protein NEPG_01375 [Nematocida parisii ERTm1]EIJ88130.1 hypothetical protein NEQG_01574 [Nematocida parisii ERTm3]KAI5130792.1 hypothetical protein NEPAR03_2218 [Nematocida parisii]KAI5166569.1 hypothetical protein NEIRO02_1244 [Nematocida sp. AWRm79]KAI5183592.1 hypothetical protein NEIRO03_1174 [Nematocida sp. AWRm78]OAG32881.1 hypothetical protein NEIG_01760 [Nematocida sp. ERTm5]|eukprot:XP_013059203.1 hypothetical protein NEPG_01375 [Nematocida parisii ERTm1]